MLDNKKIYGKPLAMKSDIYTDLYVYSVKNIKPNIKVSNITIEKTLDSIIEKINDIKKETKKDNY